MQLRDKRALVTGSTAGTGLVAAVGLIKEGVSLVVNGRAKEWIEQVVAGIRPTSGDGEVSGIAADVSYGESAAR